MNDTTNESAEGRYTHGKGTKVCNEFVDFELTDERGRSVGFLFTVYETTAHAVDTSFRYYSWIPQITRPGQWFFVCDTVTRNGGGYGASHGTRYFETLAAAVEHGKKQCAAARKRYGKKYAKTV